MVAASRILGNLLDSPIKSRSHGLSRYRTTGFADGHQLTVSPFFRTVLPELGHEQSVRQHDQVHVPCLAPAVAQLTSSHAKLLLAVPMKGLRACPAIAINQQDPSDFPASAVGDQDLAGFTIAFPIPDNDDSYFMLDIRDADSCREIPLLLTATLERLPAFRFDLGSHFLRLQFVTLPPDLPVELQVAHITSWTVETVFLRVDVVETLGIGKEAVESEITGNLPLTRPVDQLTEEFRGVQELFARFLALRLLPEAAELQRIVFSAGADVIGDQVIMGQFASLFSVIPKPADVFDQLAIVVDQYVIDRDNTAVRVLRARILLKPLEPLLVHLLLIPLNLRQKPVEAGLITGHGELAVHATHGFSRGNHQAREVLGKMSPLGLANKQVAELLDGRRDDGWKRSDPWHACTIRDCHGHLKYTQSIPKPPVFSRRNRCLQKSS